MGTQPTRAIAADVQLCNMILCSYIFTYSPGQMTSEHQHCSQQTPVLCRALTHSLSNWAAYKIHCSNHSSPVSCLLSAGNVSWSSLGPSSWCNQHLSCHTGAIAASTVLGHTNRVLRGSQLMSVLAHRMHSACLDASHSGCNRHLPHRRISRHYIQQQC